MVEGLVEHMSVDGRCMGISFVQGLVGLVDGLVEG